MPADLESIYSSQPSDSDDSWRITPCLRPLHPEIMPTTGVILQSSASCSVIRS